MKGFRTYNHDPSFLHRDISSTFKLRPVSFTSLLLGFQPLLPFLILSPFSFIAEFIEPDDDGDDYGNDHIIDDVDLFARRTTFTPATAFQPERVVPGHASTGCAIDRSKDLSVSTTWVKKNMDLALTKAVPQVKLPPVQFKGKGWD